MADQRRIAVISSSRADYGYLYWILKELGTYTRIRTDVVAMAGHLSPTLGRTIDQIGRDGIRVTESVECLLDSDSDVGMAKTIGLGTLGLADTLGRLRPDLLLIPADRYEMLAPASVALALRIPVAHLEGGESSLGAIDDPVRHALTKLSHLHLVYTDAAADRVRALGEAPWRIHVTGAPSLDHLRRAVLVDRAGLERRLGLRLSRPLIVVSVHPVTLMRDGTGDARAVTTALHEAPGQVIFCYPNADAGSRELIRSARTFCQGRPGDGVYVNLPPRIFWSLLRHADVLVGNSSAGIMEAPSLGLPTVNVGRRQEGRLRAASVIDASAEPAAIRAALERALTPDFRQSLAGMTNPYGDGRSAARIARVLAGIPVDDQLLFKEAVAGVGSGDGRE